MMLRSATSGSDCADLATEELFFFFGEFSWLDACLLDYVEKSI